MFHSLRHSLRDRLSAVECPSNIIGQIGGWTTQASVMPMAEATAWRYWLNGCRRLSAEIYSATPSIIIKSVSEHSSLTAFAA